jgi:hypothetical protein
MALPSFWRLAGDSSPPNAAVEHAGCARFVGPRGQVGAERGRAKRSPMMSISPATASGRLAAGKNPGRHARERHGGRGATRRRHFGSPQALARSPRALARRPMARRRRVAVWRSGALRPAGVAGGQLMADRQGCHHRGRAGPPTRCAEQAPRSKFRKLGPQAAAVPQPSRLRSGDGVRPTARLRVPRAPGSGHR